jgi:Fe-S-cluster-containing hydrogenase component 2
MREVKVNKEKCPADHWCVGIKACPEKAISQEDKDKHPVVDCYRCIKCNICIDLCPYGAIERKHVF